MTQVSKLRIEPKIEKDILDAFSYCLKELRNKNEVDTFLLSILTKTERIMIAKRVLTAYLLENKVEEGKISKSLKLTPATITRLKMWISLHKEGFDLVFKKLNKKTAEDVAKQVLLKILKYASSAAFGKTPSPFTMH